MPRTGNKNVAQGSRKKFTRREKADDTDNWKEPHPAYQARRV
jgi:hypothetical protein